RSRHTWIRVRRRRRGRGRHWRVRLWYHVPDQRDVVLIEVAVAVQVEFVFVAFRFEDLDDVIAVDVPIAVGVVDFDTEHILHRRKLLVVFVDVTVFVDVLHVAYGSTDYLFVRAFGGLLTLHHLVFFHLGFG